MRARGAQAQTGARARDAQAKTGAAREVREQGARALRARSLRTRARANKLSKSGFGELICDLESFFARAESLFAQARVGRARAREHVRAHLGLACAPSRARALLFARASRSRALARAPVVARAPGARTC